MPSGVPKNVPPSGTPAGRAAFALSMRRLAEVEALPVYAEMRALADQRVLEESARARWKNGQVAGMSLAQAEAWCTGQTHGRIATYAAGCRCDECRDASAAAKRRQRAKAAS